MLSGGQGDGALVPCLIPAFLLQFPPASAIILPETITTHPKRLDDWDFPAIRAAFAVFRVGAEEKEGEPVHYGKTEAVSNRWMFDTTKRM